MLVLKIILVVFIGSVVSTPVDEFRSLVNEGELSIDDNKHIKTIIPSGYSQLSYEEINSMPEIITDDNEYFKTFYLFVKNGTTEKSLTFNIYNDNMRQAVIALFRLLQNMKNDEYDSFKNWADKNINRGILNYAINLNYLYSPMLNRKEIIQKPCYTENPNYYVNSETILKALRVRLALSFRDDIRAESKIHQFHQLHNLILINTNYSGWNLQQNGGEENINYFREDISLNCYYLGVHLLHPFWMSNEELDELNPRHAEHYYYLHQQLLARYNLESEHLRQQLKTSVTTVGDTDYNPYLMYENGLPFPVRPAFQNVWNDKVAELKAIDLAIHEFISRGLIIMHNGTIMNMTSDSDINLLAKLIRANFDGIKIGKSIRSLLGYGSNGYPEDQYNPAPSVLHHPETTLRDPFYWQVMKIVMSYFVEFKNTMEPFDLSQYETDEFIISSSNFTNIITFFDYYLFPINKALSHNDNYISKKWPILARQRRLQHLPFTLNFTVESTKEENVVIRLFLGPPCNQQCWNEFSHFYELDSFNYLLQDGLNILSWSPDKSSKFSFDNDNVQKDYSILYNKPSLQKKNKYNMFKFPQNLLIPKGLDEGLHLKLFIMITPADEPSLTDYIPENNYYKKVSSEVDTKPLGFPFHRLAKKYRNDACNYKFFDIIVYHNHYPVDKHDYIPSNLY